MSELPREHRPVLANSWPPAARARRPLVIRRLPFRTVAVDFLVASGGRHLPFGSITGPRVIMRHPLRRPSVGVVEKIAPLTRIAGDRVCLHYSHLRRSRHPAPGRTVLRHGRNDRQDRDGGFPSDMVPARNALSLPEAFRRAGRILMCSSATPCTLL